MKVLYRPLEWHLKGLQQTATGYGKKLTTPYKAEYNGKLYRVYCCCFSNNGTLYIQSKGNDITVEFNQTDVGYNL